MSTKKSRKDIKGLTLTINEKEYIVIGENIRIYPTKVNGNWRIVLDMDKNIPIVREKYVESEANL